MHHSDELSQPCEDRDFAEWHRGCAWCAVWVVMLDHGEVLDAMAQGRRRLGDALLPRYARQPHITVAYRGLCQRGGHEAQEFGPQDLQRDVALLQALKPAPFALQLGGAGSFTTVPYLALQGEDAALQRLHAALVPQSPAPGWSYVPHVTLGHYARQLPLAEVMRQLAETGQSLPRIKISQLTLARYASADIAGPLTVEGVFELGSGRYSPAPDALWP